MNTFARVGQIAALWRFPVKSMLGERVETTHVTAGGLVGDRGYAIFDIESGKVASAVDVKRFPRLFAFSASYARTPEPGERLPPVRIRLPDGSEVSSESGDVDQVLTTHLGREVRLIRGEDPILGAGKAGQSVPGGDPVSVLTLSTLRALGELRPESKFDERRFRMNIMVDADQGGFPENDWVGQRLAIGRVVRLTVTRPDARCIMTTLAQDELPEDPGILRTLARHNRIRIREGGVYACAGVYADVASEGRLAVGDAVRFRRASPRRAPREAREHPGHR